MSNPTEPTPPQPDEPTAVPPVEPVHPADAQPTQAYPPADAQPTQAYPPADAQPTEAYPPADVQPTQAYPPAGQPGYPQPGYGQPAAPAYGQSAAYSADPAAAPVSNADRPRTLGWVALAIALGGLALVGAAFIPLVGVSIVLAALGGVLLLVALVFGIITLASKKQGGKGLGIGAIALSVLGGLAWMAAMTFAVVLTIGSVAGSSTSEPSPSASVEATDPEDEGAEDGAEQPAGAYDEAAYLAQVRPEILAIMQEVEPSITEETLTQLYSDDMLVSTGQALLGAGDAARDAFISSTVESSGGVFTEDQAARFYDAVHDGAQQYLVE